MDRRGPEESLLHRFQDEMIHGFGPGGHDFALHVAVDPDRERPDHRAHLPVSLAVAADAVGCEGAELRPLATVRGTRGIIRECQDPGGFAVNNADASLAESVTTKLAPDRESRSS